MLTLWNATAINCETFREVTPLLAIFSFLHISQNSKFIFPKFFTYSRYISIFNPKMESLAGQGRARGRARLSEGNFRL